GPVHHAEAALAQERLDTVPPGDHVAGLEGHALLHRLTWAASRGGLPLVKRSRVPPAGDQDFRDAIGQMLASGLLTEKRAHARVEFKLEVLRGNPIHHFFDAIDVIICWKVGKPGPIYGESSASIGQLQRRTKSALSPAIDTYEIGLRSGSNWNCPF